MYLSEFICHEERRGIGFGLHVGHMWSSRGVDMVGRKHLEDQKPAATLRTELPIYEEIKTKKRKMKLMDGF